MTERKKKSPSGAIERAICEALKTDVLSNLELAAITGIDRSSVIRNTNRMLTMGIIRRAGMGETNNGANKFYYYALVKAREFVAPVLLKTVNPKEGQPHIKRKQCSADQVPYLNWWEGGGLYANLDDQETRLVA